MQSSTPLLGANDVSGDVLCIMELMVGGTWRKGKQANSRCNAERKYGKHNEMEMKAIYKYSHVDQESLT